MGMDHVFEKYCTARGLFPVDPEVAAQSNPAIAIVSRVCEAQLGLIRSSFPKIQCVSFGFIDRPGLAAAADLWNDTAVIRFGAAVPTILCNLIAAGFTHEHGFARLLPPDPVILDPRSFRSSQAHLLESLFNNGCMIEALYPNQNALRHLMPLSTACCNFLFWHEFIHIRNGHVDLYRNGAGLAALEEINAPMSEALSALDFQTMEYDADTISHIIACEFAVSMMHEQVVDFPTRQRFEAFRLFHVGLYLMFKLVEHAEGVGRGDRRHPTPMARMMLLLDAVPNVAEKLKLGEVAEAFAAEVIISGEATWAFITGGEMVDLHEVGKRLLSRQEEIIAILGNWNSLRERLSPFNRGITPLAQPNAFEREA